MAKKSYKQQFLEQLHEGTESNFSLGLGIGIGIFMGIVPVWGFQMIAALALAHILKLNKPIVLLFSNVSIPPIMPFILFASLQSGSILISGEWVSISVREITLDASYHFLLYYLVGSVVFAFVCGSLAFLISWCLLNQFRKSERLKNDDRKFPTSS